MSDSNTQFNEKGQELIAEKICYFNKESFPNGIPKRLNQIPLHMLQSNTDGQEYLKTPEGKKYKAECEAKQKDLCEENAQNFDH